MPALPGCSVSGRMIAEARERLKEALSVYAGDLTDVDRGRDQLVTRMELSPATLGYEPLGSTDFVNVYGFCQPALPA